MLNETAAIAVVAETPFKLRPPKTLGKLNVKRSMNIFPNPTVRTAHYGAL